MAAPDLTPREERYREFFEDDLTGDFVAGPDGSLLECNPAYLKILGFASLEAARRVNLQTLFPSPEAYQGFLARLRAERKLIYHEQELVRVDGTRVHVVENVIGRFDGQGELAGYKGYMFDDTRRKRLEDQLHQSQKMESIGTMASGIAHDFNNILNTVLGFAAQLQKHPQDPEKVLRYSQTIEKSALRGAELSARILSFARVSRREDAPVDVARIVNEVAALCAESFPRGVLVERRVDTPLDFVRGDHAALYQVLLNLAVNARDAVVARHGTAGGSIAIQARNTLAGDDVSPELIGGPDLRCVEIRVIDNGTGIGPDVRERIFDPFFTTKERGQGTGLGLSVVYTIVRNHRGTILVESKPGDGSTFRVLLPAMAPGAILQPAGKPALPARGRGELVLIVDDEDSMIDLATELLVEQGYRVLTARNGAQAIRVLEQSPEKIRLAILDLVMPGMDGEQTYRELKKRDPVLKAVLCTGYMPGELRAHFVTRERLHVVHKPFTPESLLSAVREAIDSPPLA